MRSILLVAVLPAFVGAKTLSVDFSTFASSGLTVAQFLDQSSLYVSAYEVQTSYPSDPTADPFPHTFVTDNVDIQDGYLTLKVSGPTAQGASVLSAEVGTYDSNILYGTFKTVAIASPVPGVVHGFFTYKNDCQESDIELLTSFYTTGNTFVQPGLQLTNQNLQCDHTQNTHTQVAYPADPTAAEHEARVIHPSIPFSSHLRSAPYTLIWNSSATTYLFDGTVVATLNSNVPTEPSSFLWNSWSGGNERWSAGPPTQDAILKIKSISLDYETA
ncbi:concanavalin A-like lectin/glucanase [Dichomitus squalens]|uniref:Concanavalin A-like lectin/glucanase n=1 Tax=Dichomitus squalens TaxID=114155 RepID=A0A4Q9PEU0_9APHY|nr:concanavalin A-like lectin/glucanase [Dichomitus squalens]TBU53454.1 concanavalin A-like lectin/glucanase [Dichomitus squalens]